MTPDKQRRPGQGVSEADQAATPKRNSRRKPRAISTDADAPPFAMIPTVALADRNLLESELRVLGAVCSFRNAKTGLAWPRIDLLAKRTDLSRATVKLAVHELVERGYLTREAEYNQRSGARTSNTYTVPMMPTYEDWLREPPASQTDRGWLDRLAEAGQSEWPAPASTTSQQEQTIQQTTEQIIEHRPSGVREADPNRCTALHGPSDDCLEACYAS
jgi:hypothetical protein